jgi:hypothetical protein
LAFDCIHCYPRTYRGYRRGCCVGVHTQRKRVGACQAALESYSANLQIGMTRKQVEDYLRSRSIKFNRVDAEYDHFLIGDEGSDWVCAQKLEYIELHFAPTPQGVAWAALDSDTLTRINLRFRGQCL